MQTKQENILEETYPGQGHRRLRRYNNRNMGDIRAYDVQGRSAFNQNWYQTIDIWIERPTYMS